MEITIRPWPFDSPEAEFCQHSYFAELRQRFPQGFDNRPFTGSGVGEVFFLLQAQGEPKGCGMLMRLSPEVAEIKRMWVSGSLRGMGLGKQLLAQLEAEASRRGFRTVRLDTHGSLTEAIAMYRSQGYREIPSYNGNPYATHWFEKQLPQN